jgi:hypothetical protein
MTETTAGITRPSIGDVYNDLTGLDDAAIRTHTGHDLDLLMDLFYDAALTNRQWIELTEVLEFLEIRKRPNTPDELAAQLVREMTRGQLGDCLEAYMAATFPKSEDDESEVDPESAEGKDSPPIAKPASSARKRTSPSAPRSSASSE